MVQVSEKITKLIGRLTPKPGENKTYSFTLPALPLSEIKGLYNMFKNSEQSDYTVTIYHQVHPKEIHINFTKVGSPESLAPNYNAISIFEGVSKGAIMSHDLFYLKCSPHLTEMNLQEYQYCLDIDTSLDTEKYKGTKGLKRVIELSSSDTPRYANAPHICQEKEPHPKYDERALKAFSEDPESELADNYRSGLAIKREMLLEGRGQLLEIMLDHLHEQISHENFR